MNLITDRVASDVDAVSDLADAIRHGTATAEQVREYLDVEHKGAYTYRDLNRVETAVLYVGMRLVEYGYLGAVPVTHSWEVSDFPTETDWNRYFGNVLRIRNALSVWASTPAAPGSVVGFDIEQANALEQILVDVDQILTHISGAWFYSGDLYAAEV